MAKAVSAATSAEPMGLLISWAMPAPSNPMQANRSLRRTASSRFVCTVTSRKTAIRCVIRPDSSRTGSDRSCKSVREPSGPQCVNLRRIDFLALMALLQALPERIVIPGRIEPEKMGTGSEPLCAGSAEQASCEGLSHFRKARQHGESRVGIQERGRSIPRCLCGDRHTVGSALDGPAEQMPPDGDSSGRAEPPKSAINTSIQKRRVPHGCPLCKVARVHRKDVTPS